MLALLGHIDVGPRTTKESKNAGRNKNTAPMTTLYRRARSRMCPSMSAQYVICSSDSLQPSQDGTVGSSNLCSLVRAPSPVCIVKMSCNCCASVTSSSHTNPISVSDVADAADLIRVPRCVFLQFAMMKDHCVQASSFPLNFSGWSNLESTNGCGP